MPEQVDTRVSLSLHPHGVTAIEGFDESTAPYVAEAVSAFNDAYQTIGKIWDATEHGKRNGAWTEEQRVLAVGKVANKEQDRLCRKFDGAHAHIKKAAEFVDGELSRPLIERAGLGNLNGEVRAHAKALDRADRAKLLNEAMAANDTDTLQAILGAQPFLSGLSAPEHAHYLRRFHEQQNPALLARLTTMRAALDKIERDSGKLFSEIERAVGAPPATVRGIDAANERALAALKISPA